MDELFPNQLVAVNDNTDVDPAGNLDPSIVSRLPVSSVDNGGAATLSVELDASVGT
jgi:hypothetical protein